jgi:hypothetical protein
MAASGHRLCAGCIGLDARECLQRRQGRSMAALVAGAAGAAAEVFAPMTRNFMAQGSAAAQADRHVCGHEA